MPKELALEPADVLVVGYSLDVADATNLRGILDEAERLRADRFVNAVHRRRFTVAHAGLRLVLAYLVGQSPQSLSFHVGAYGKPALANPDLDVRFNLSHADNRALIAIARGRELGIDIEQERSVQALELARQYFSPRECAALERMSAPDRLHAFYRGWTRKESFIKANGRGLSYALDSFEVSLDELPENALLASLAEDSERYWQIRSLEMDEPFAAAITVEGEDWRLIRHETSVAELQELFPIHTSTKCLRTPPECSSEAGKIKKV